MWQELGFTPGYLAQPVVRSTFMAPHPFILTHRPSGEHPIEMSPNWIHGRLVVAAVIVEPSLEHGPEHPRQIEYRFVAFAMQGPCPDSPPDFRSGLIAYCRTEVNEILTPAILRPPGLKRVAQEVKLFVDVSAFPVIILAVDDFCLLRMKLQFAFCKAGRNGCL